MTGATTYTRGRSAVSVSTRPRGPRRSAPFTGLLLVLGSIVTAGATFLPYEQVSGATGSYTVTGSRAETASGVLTTQMFDVGWGGWVVFGCAVIAALQGLRVLTGRGGLPGALVVVGVTGAAATVSYLLLHAPERRLPPGFIDTLGVGVQLAGAGVGLACLGAVLALLARPQR